MSRPTEAEFERLVHAHHAAVYRSARRVAADEADALDATQGVFLAVLEGRLRLDDADEPGAVLAWWAVKGALAQRRGADRRRRREEAHAMERDEATTEDAVERADEARTLWTHIEKLPDDTRIPLMLRFAEGLSYARIGEALACAEPTAHDRVRRGLERLRAMLTRAGLAALVVGLESRLARAEPGAAPEGLAERLLALKGTTSAAGSLALYGVVGAGLAAVAAFAVIPTLRGDGGGSADAREPVALVAPETPTDTTTAGPAAGARNTTDDDGRAALGTLEAGATSAQDPAGLVGWLEGRVLDPDGTALADTRVVVDSAELAGKFAAFSTVVHTDAQGRFRAEVSLPNDRGRRVRACVYRLGYASVASEYARVEPGETTRLDDLSPAPGAGDLAADFVLEVAVVGPDGAPVPGVRLELSHVRPTPERAVGSWAEWYSNGDELRQRDDGGSTDEAGRLALAGSRLGDKALLVLPPSDEYAPALVEFQLDEARRELVVPLEAGYEISGTLLDTEGRPPTDVQLVLVWEHHWNWEFFELEDDGRFHARGLGRGEYSLQVPGSGDTWSPIRHTVRAGDRDLEIVIKRADDVRDIGHHAGEIHGRLVDAGTGRPVVAKPGAVHARWCSPDVARSARDPERDMLPNLIFPMPVQQAVLFGGKPYEPPPPTDEFHVVGIQSGHVVLHVDVPGYGLAAAGPFEMGEHAWHEGVEIELHPEGSLAGRVIDARDRAVDGALVFVAGSGPASDRAIAEIDAAYREADGRGFHHANGGRRADASGRYRRDRLPVGRELVVVAIHPDWEPVRSAPIAAEPDGAEVPTLRFVRARGR